MTTFQQLDKALRAKGWRYDIGEEQFFDGDGTMIRDYRKLTALVRGMTLDELLSYQDQQYDRRGKHARVR
jgi:hypothetical protein